MVCRWFGVVWDVLGWFGVFPRTARLLTPILIGIISSFILRLIGQRLRNVQNKV